MKPMILLAFSAVLFKACYGSDQAWLRLVGFSQDGVYAAWETGGVQDGSGFPWLRVEVINTETSLPEKALYKVWEEECINPDPALTGGMTADLCAEFEIEEGSIGDPLIFHPVTDLGVSPDTVSFCLEHYFPGYNSGRLTMVLENLPAALSQGYPDWFPSPVSLRITLAGDLGMIFFSEETVPEDYRYVFCYSFAGVYRNPVNNRSLLVVLHTQEPGFEGSDGRFRVVSGAVLPQ